MSSKPIYDGPRRVTDTATFIQKAQWVHSGKYDYSQSSFIKSQIKTPIICPDHGVFYQTPNNHLTGGGCGQCAIDQRAEKRRSTTEKFIEKATKIHQGFYDYSKVSYKNNHTKVTITCPVHGDFQQTPMKHLTGRKCIKCAKQNILTLDEFIALASKQHNNKYDYSLVKYHRYDTEVDIICPTHGVFTQRAHIHLRAKSGCKKCAFERHKGVASNLAALNDENRYDPCILYHVKFTRLDGSQFEKIGITALSVEKRFKELESRWSIETMFEHHSTREECLHLEEQIIEELEKDGHRYRVPDLRNSVVRGYSECFHTGVIRLEERVR